MRTGAGLGIADYPRFWDEANLTIHLARPLLTAATGFDVPQLLAGDVAPSAAAADDVLAADGAAAGRRLVGAVACSGIGAFFLLTTAARHSVGGRRRTAAAPATKRC
ncbi:hypothetical protein ACWEO1_16755 [Kitasatospora cineracea]